MPTGFGMPGGISASTARSRIRSSCGGLAETLGEGQGKVVGVDAGGQWPGGDDERPGAAFVRSIFQPVDVGAPDDVFNPVQSPTDPK